MNNLEISKYLYSCLSTFREANGQSAYLPFVDVSSETLQLYDLVIEAIRDYEITNAEEVHEYWKNYAKSHDPFHKCIVSYFDNSKYEKAKDQLVLEIINILIEL